MQLGEHAENIAQEWVDPKNRLDLSIQMTWSG